MKKRDLSVDERVGGYPVFPQDAESNEGLHAGGEIGEVVSRHGAVGADEAHVLNVVSYGIGVERIPFELFRKVEETNPFVRCNGGEEEDLVFCKLRVFLRALELQLCKLSSISARV